MSWQAYVDNHLLGTRKIAKAAILGLQGGVWASSPGYTLSDKEQKDIINGYNDLTRVQANGIHAGGQKFYTLSADPRSIYGKKKADGIIIVRTKQAVLVAEYVAPIQAAEAAPVVERLGDHLISAGY